MALLKRIVTVVALVYLLFASLMLFFPFVRNSAIGIFSAYSLQMETNLLLILVWSSLAVVGLLLVFENIDSGLLRRNVAQQERKINELKAQLFDSKRTTALPPSGIPIAQPTTYDNPEPSTPSTF